MANKERLISVWKLDTVLAKKFRSGSIHYDDLMAIIADIPTVDAEEVVRCKNCKFWFDNDCQNEGALLLPTEDDFCSYGERREGNGKSTSAE